MEIAKEKFIETFKKECQKSVENSNPNAFISSGGDEEPACEIIASEKISFYVAKMYNFDNSEAKGYKFVGKILFRGFVDYKSIELTEEEFESIFEFFYEQKDLSRVQLKNKIISEGESDLQQLIQYNSLKYK